MRGALSFWKFVLGSIFFYLRDHIAFPRNRARILVFISSFNCIALTWREILSHKSTQHVLKGFVVMRPDFCTPVFRSSVMECFRADCTVDKHTTSLTCVRDKNNLPGLEESQGRGRAKSNKIIISYLFLLGLSVRVPCSASVS